MSAEVGAEVSAEPSAGPSPDVDPPSLIGLAPISLLAARVDQLNARARAQREDANDGFALLVVYTAPTRSPSDRERYMRAVHAAMSAAMPAGEFVARLGPRAAAAIVTREPRALRDTVHSLNAQIDIALWEDRLPTTRVCIEPLPTSGGRLALLLTDL